MSFLAEIRPPYSRGEIGPDVTMDGNFDIDLQRVEGGWDYARRFASSGTGLVDATGTSRVTATLAVTELSHFLQATAFLGYFSANIKYTLFLGRFTRPRGSTHALALRQSVSAQKEWGPFLAPVIWIPAGDLEIGQSFGLSAGMSVDPARNEDEVYGVTCTVEAWVGGAAVGGFAISSVSGSFTEITVNGMP